MIDPDQHPALDALRCTGCDRPIQIHRVYARPSCRDCHPINITVDTTDITTRTGKLRIPRWWADEDAFVEFIRTCDRDGVHIDDFVSEVAPTADQHRYHNAMDYLQALADAGIATVTPRWPNWRSDPWDQTPHGSDIDTCGCTLIVIRPLKRPATNPPDAIAARPKGTTP